MTVPRYLILALLSASLACAQIVLLPSLNPINRLNVYDKEKRVLVRHPGGFETFFCDDCPREVTLYIRNSSAEILILWINEEGKPIRFLEDVEIGYVGEGESRATAVKGTPEITLSITVPSTADSFRTKISATIRDSMKSLILLTDNIPPRVNFESVTTAETADSFAYQLVVSFTEPVVWGAEAVECPEMQMVNSENTTSFDLIQLSQECNTNLLEKKLGNGVSVKGGRPKFLSLDSTSFFVSIFVPDKDKNSDIEIEVDKGYSDYAGNGIEEGLDLILYYRPFPPPRQRQDRLIRRDVALPRKKRWSGKAAGQVATVAVAAASSASFASSASSGSAGSGGSAVNMLNNVQKIHMTGMLAVTSLPSNYKNFTEETKWAVLDIKIPGNRTNRRNGTSVASRNETQNGGRSLLQIDAFFEAGEDESEWAYFKRMLFWIPTLFVVVGTLHFLLVGFLVLKSKQVPEFFAFPRIELMLMFFCLPPIAISCAGLYRSTRDRAMLGTWIIIAVPVNFIVWNLYMLWNYVLSRPPHLREANLISDIPNKRQKALSRVKNMIVKRREIKKSEFYKSHRHRKTGSRVAMLHGHSSSGLRTEDMEIEMSDSMTNNQVHRGETSGSERLSAHEDIDEDEAPRCSEILKSIASMTFLDLLFGEHQEESEWVTTRTQGSLFVSRWGLLFEEHRGPAIGRKEATWEVDPDTGQVDRGELVILKERPLLVLPGIGKKGDRFYIPKKKIYRYHLQIMTKLIDVGKTILVGCIIAGVGNSEDNVGSVIALMAISLGLIFLLRVSKPFPSRVDMFVLLISELADLIVYTCALFILLGPNTDEDTDDNIGMALLLSESFAVLAMVIEYSMISVGTVLVMREERKIKKQHKFFDAVHRSLMMNDMYLQKKYFDRWMVKTLGKGVLGRLPARHELPLKFALKQNLAYMWDCIKWVWEEITKVCDDGKRKIDRWRDRED